MSALDLCPECTSPRVTKNLNTNTNALYELKCHDCGLVYIIPAVEEGRSRFDECYDGKTIEIQHGNLVYI